MNRKLSRWVCIGCLLFVLPAVVQGELTSGLDGSWEFDQITYRDGLVNSSVSIVLQDETGFLWFGSQAGLHRYDGYTMDVITAEPFNRDSLSNQLVQTAYFGADGALWVGTYGGLDRYDTATGAFTPFSHAEGDHRSLSNNVVTGITEDDSGTLWVATLGGLNRLDSPEEGVFTRFLHADTADGLPHNTVRSVFRSSRGGLWVGSLGGLSRVSPEPAAPTGVAFTTWGAEHFSSPYVMAIDEDAGGALWLAVWDAGLIRFDSDTGETREYPLSDNRVYAVRVTRDGLVLAATWGGGLVVLDPETGQQYTYRHQPGVSHSLAHDVVYSIFEDASGILWVGTNGNGISKVDRSRLSFRFLGPELPQEYRPGTGKVHVMMRHDPRGDLYIGLQNGGLNVMDRESGRIRQYLPNPHDPGAISNGIVNGLLAEPEGTVLVSTHGGINRYYPPEGTGPGRFELLDIVPDPIVYRMIRGPRGYVWIGTYSNGVFRWDPRSTEPAVAFSHLPEDPGSLSNNLVYDLAFDRDGTLWVATNDGLNRLLPDATSFQRFLYDPDNTRGISASNTSNILIDSRGTLWVGSRSGGLNRFDRASGTFSHYTTVNGLSTNTVTALQEGNDGRLYIATPNGMNVLDPDSGEISLLDERDGLHLREFSTGSLRDSDGALLFGGFSEVIRVVPQRRSHGTVSPRTVITDTFVSGVLRNEDPLQLDYRQNALGFRFAVLEFTVPGRNSYQYRLAGLDERWIDAGQSNTANYTNLSPGTYRFEVIGIDARGNISPAVAVRTIVITPPFWQTRLFVSAVILLLLSMGVLAYSLRTRSLRRQNAKLEATVQERTAELSTANAVKDRFFSIIAHDLRGPMAGIASICNGAASDVRSYPPETVEEIFQTLQSTSRGLMRMLENLLEWARVQSRGLTVVPIPVSLTVVAVEVMESYRSAAQAKSIEMEFSGDDNLRVLADPNMIRVVLENLVNNAVKFTGTGGTVAVEWILQGHGEGTIVIRDSGVGIPPDLLATLFDVGSRTRTTGTEGERGSGFGLALCRDLVERQNGRITVESVVGSGTEVTVTLPAINR